MLREFLLILTFLVFARTAFAYGPFDYTNPDHFRDKLPVVEQYHFNSNVENLRSGMHGSIMDDLAYVLRSFPNHHRALNSMSRLWRQKLRMGEQPALSNTTKRLTPEQYFERAIQFSPADGTVYLLYAIHLHKLGKFQKALEMYKQSLKYQHDNAEIHYNIGLLYTDIKEYDKALKHAHIAYQKKYPLSGLRSRLKKAGAWKNLPTNPKAGASK